jgi:hypothetical protein
MTEAQITAIEIDTETEEAPLTLESVVEELVTVAFGENATVTPYKIATVINGTFEALGNEKRIPTQMMYNYDRNGLIVKGKKSTKAYDMDEVTKYVTKYTSKFVK